MQGAAGVGHHGPHAEFGEHVRGRFHLGGPARGVPGGAVEDPLHAARVGRGQFGGDVLAQPLLIACRPGRVQRLDDGRGHALVEHAAQQFPAGREPGRPGQDLNASAQRGQQAGVALGAVPAGHHGDTQAAAGDGSHHRDVREGHAAGFGDARQLPLDARRGGIEVGPEGAGPQAGQSGPEGVHRGLSAVHAQHQICTSRRLGLAGGVGDARARGDGRVVAADSRARGQQVTRDHRTGLPEAEHRDNQQGLVRVHHARGGSARTLTPSGGVACPGGAAPASAARPSGGPARSGWAGADCLKYSLISSRCWARIWSKCLSTFCSPIASAVRYRSLSCSSLRARVRSGASRLSSRASSGGRRACSAGGCCPPAR